MKIGIPRALLYYKYERLWTTFFDELGIDYIVSPETDKEIVANGTKFAVDEACLPVKIFLGHIYYLIDKCDYIFLPRIEGTDGGDLCMNFKAEYDLVKNTFRNYNLKILYYNIPWNKVHKEFKFFKKMGKFLGFKTQKIRYAYFVAKQSQINFEMFRTCAQEKVLEESEKNKVLIVAHAYNVGDRHIGKPVIDTLKKLDCEPIIAEYADSKKCIKLAENVSKTMPWAYNKHLMGAIDYYGDKIDGIIILTTFPCGPDSMVNEMILHKYKGKPILLLTLDAQDGTAGIETRIESYVDILNFKRERKEQQKMKDSMRLQQTLLKKAEGKASEKNSVKPSGEESKKSKGKASAVVKKIKNLFGKKSEKEQRKKNDE